MPNMAISTNRIGNLILKDTRASNFLYYLLYGILGTGTGFIGIVSIINRDLYFIYILICLIISGFSFYAIWVAFRFNRYFEFNREVSEVKFIATAGKARVETSGKYKHAETVERSDGRGGREISLVLLLDEDNKYHLINKFDYFQREKAYRVRDFCIEVLKRTGRYNPPAKSLQETLAGDKGTEMRGIIVEGLKGAVRGMQ